MVAVDQVRFGILGPLTAHAGARTLDVGSPKQKAVLALLLIHANSALSVDRIVAEMWPVDPPRTAEATLQAYISNLRRALEPDRPARSKATALVNRRGSYELVVDPAQIDAREFERLTERAGRALDSDPGRARDDYLEGLALWRGPALVEFSFDDFAAAEIHRLDELRITATENRVAADLALGKAQELVAELERLVGQHPLRERTWAHLMLALYRSGRQAEALRAYRRCEEILGEELGIVPSLELRALEEAILHQDAQVLAIGASPASAGDTVVEAGTAALPRHEPAPVIAGNSLVGRSTELETFHRLVDRAQVGCGSMLLIEGEAGIGKTRLLEAFLAQARERGLAGGLARCVEIGGTPPFWPWIQVARALNADTFIPEGQLRIDGSGDAGPQAAETKTGRTLYRVAEGIVSAIRTLTEDQPIALLIDDLYSADPDSLAALTLVASQLEHLPVVIVGSHRGVDLPPEHPLVDVLIHTRRLHWVHRAQLSRFNVAEVGELIRKTAGEAVDSPFAEAVHQRTDGNAFFTVELIRLLESEGALTPRGAMFAVPLTVREVINRRLAQLPDDAVLLLRAGACTGRTFDLQIAADAARISLDAALDLAEFAVTSGLVAEDSEPGKYRFSHVLVVDSVTDAIGALRRAQLHERIGAAIEDRYGDDPAAWLAIAHHRVEAVPISGRPPAIAALTVAGRNAVSAQALELAEQLFERRLNLVLASPASDERDASEVEALLDLALVWTWKDGYHVDRLRHATERLLSLTKASEQERLTELVSRAGASYGVLSTYQALSSLEIVAGRVDGALAVAQEQLRLAEADPEPYVVAVASLNAAVAYIHAGRIRDALDRISTCRSLLDTIDPEATGSVMLPLGDQSMAVTCHSFAGWALWLAGDGEAARIELKKARAICERINHSFSAGFLTAIEAMVATMEGSLQWLADTLEWGGGWSEPGVFGLIDTWLEVHRLWLTGMRNPSAEAAAAYRSALVGLEDLGASVSLTFYYGNLAALHLAADDPQSALATADEAIDRSQIHGERFWYPELERLRAVALGRLGRVDEATDARSRSEMAAKEMGVGAVTKRLSVAAAMS